VREVWDLKRLKNQVVSTTGCKVNDLAISIIVSSYLYEVSEYEQDKIKARAGRHSKSTLAWRSVDSSVKPLFIDERSLIQVLIYTEEYGVEHGYFDRDGLFLDADLKDIGATEWASLKDLRADDKLKCGECNGYYSYDEMVVTGDTDICAHCDLERMDEVEE